jgi:hypothetical protein
MPTRAIKEDDVDGALTVVGIARILPILAAGGAVEAQVAGRLAS